MKLKGFWIALALCTAVIFGVTSIKYPQVDVQDEAIYLDHLIRASKLDLGQSGDFFSVEAIEEICWRGGQPNHPSVPTNYDIQCSAADRVSEFGINHSTPMPMYYLTTGILSRIISYIGRTFGLGPLSIVTLARLAGILWYLVGAAFVVRTLKLCGHDPRLAFGLLIGCTALPSIFHEHTIVNADASSFACGASIFYFTVKYMTGKASIWPLLATSCLALLATSHNIIAVAIATLLLVLSETQRKSEIASQSFSPAIKNRVSIFGIVGLLVGVSAILTLFWNKIVMRFVSRLIYGAPDTDPAIIGQSLKSQYASSGIKWFQIFSPENITRFILPGSDNFQPFQRYGGPYNSVVIIFGMVLIAAVFTAILTRVQNETIRNLSISHLMVALVFPVLFVLQWNLQGVHDGVLARFALSSLAVPIICGSALFNETRLGRAIVWSISLTTFSAGLLTNFVSWI